VGGWFARPTRKSRDRQRVNLRLSDEPLNPDLRIIEYRVIRNTGQATIVWTMSS
jgi:hypothetical protein